MAFEYPKALTCCQPAGISTATKDSKSVSHLWLAGPPRINFGVSREGNSVGLALGGGGCVSRIDTSWYLNCTVF